MDFGEHLADCAADGEDITAPVPMARAQRLRMERRISEEETSDDSGETETVTRK